MLREFNDTPSTQVTTRIKLLNEAILVLQALQRTAAAYQPLSLEVQNLHRLYFAWLDAQIIGVTFNRDGLLTPALWLRNTVDVLTNNRLHAWDAYISAWNALHAQFQ